MALDERKVKILRAIIDDYILTAMPVGSRSLSLKSDIGLSSATIRNEMSDLELLGYLDQPHTSAGRVPSLAAFRLYVDRLMRVASLGKSEQEYIHDQIGRSTSMLEDVLANAAQVLSEVTDYASAVMMPIAPSIKFEHIQLVPITPTRALLVIVTNAGVLKDVMVSVPAGISNDMLYMISNALTQTLKGKTADAVAGAVREIREGLAVNKQFSDNLLAAISTSAAPNSHREVIFGGRSNLLKHPEYASADKMRSMLLALEPHGSIANALSQKAQMEFSISIGPELGQEMNDLSLVTVSYHLGDGQIGTMGVVGPVRMNYARVAAVLRQMQKTMNDMLNGGT